MHSTISQSRVRGFALYKHRWTVRHILVPAVAIIALSTTAFGQTGAVYPFNEGQGITAADTLGGFNGAISGATWTNGHNGTGLHFDSPQAVVRLPQALFNSFVNKAYFEAWIRPSNYKTGPQRNTIFRKRADFNDWEVALLWDGSIAATIYVGAAGPAPVWAQSAANTVPLNTWTRVVAWYDGSTMKVELNGADATATSGASSPQPIDWFLRYSRTEIGNDTLDGGGDEYRFIGDIDEVSILSDRPSSVVAPQPELSVSMSSTTAVPVKWRTANYRLSSSTTAKTYSIWAVIDPDQTIPSTMPLSQYKGRIYSSYVIDESTNKKVSERLATEIIFDVENLMLFGSTSLTDAIPLSYYNYLSQIDDSGNRYYFAQSLLTMSIPQATVYGGYNGLDVPSSRKSIYKTIILDAVLNQKMSDDDLLEKLETAWGVHGEILTNLKDSGNITQILKSDSDPYFFSIRDLKSFSNSQTLIENLDLSVDALDAMATGAKITGKVYQAFLLQALANAEAEDRLAALEDLILNNRMTNQDYVLAQAFADAKSEYLSIKNSYLTALKNAAFDGSTLQNYDAFWGYIEAGHHAFAVIKWGINPSLSVFKASHPAIQVAEKGAARAAVFAFVVTAVWDNFVTIDGKLHLVRQADLAATLAREIDLYLQGKTAFPAIVDHQVTSNLLAINNLRHYLGFSHFEKLVGVLENHFYDIFLLDVVDGLLSFYEAFNPDFTTAKNDYIAQEGAALQKYDETAPPYFLLSRNDKFAPLITAIQNESSSSLSVAPASVSAVSGQQTTLQFTLKNTGAVAGVYFLSVSMDNGLDVTLPATTNGTWTRYNLGASIYYSSGTPNPRASTKLLYEKTGTLQVGAQIQVSLTVKKTTSGRLFYRTAMRAVNAPELDVNYVRNPSSSTVLDQQGWPASSIDFGHPQPTVISDVSSLQLEVGQVQTIKFALTNTGEKAAPAYLDVSLSRGLEVLETYPVFAWDYYPAGANVHHIGEDTPRASQYPLYSSVQGQMMGQETREFYITVRSNSPTNQWIMYRTAMNPADSATSTSPDSFVRAPSAGSEDQQGWPAYTIPITMWENHPPTISALSPTQSTINVLVGQRIDFSVTAQDQDSQSVLSYVWLRDNYFVMGVSPNQQWTVTQNDLGQHRVDVVVVDGKLNVAHHWVVNVLSAIPVRKGRGQITSN